ncbi:MAG: PH domain-containing protein [Candidatus Gracilibacteria bacterium]|nr:PH domain-containing protein [Candidatus Gracilibacteria bacterium]
MFSNYLETTKMPGEDFSFEGKVHSLFVFFMSLGASFGFIFLLFSYYFKNISSLVVGTLMFAFFVYKIYGLKTKKVIITNKRFIYYDGVSKEQSLDLPLGDIKEVIVEQNMFDKYLNSGVFVIIGERGVKRKLEFLFNPSQVKGVINELLLK